MRIMQRVTMTAAIALAAVSLAQEALPGWLSKPAQAWTPEESRQVLTRSPWAARVPVTLLRLQSESERRGGGNMGRPHGVGYDYIEGAENKTKPDNPLAPLKRRSQDGLGAAGTMLLLRWETAMPVKLAELKANVMEPPTLEDDGFILAVYGVPGKFFNAAPESLGEPLKKDAVLHREGKRDVRPVRVEVFQRDSDLAVAYVFSRTEEFTRNDKFLQFRAQIGRFVVVHNFNLEQMWFQGRLEI